MTALNGIDPAVRYLEFARASESAGGRVHWQAVVGAGDEHDVLAALPPLDAARPRVVVLVRRRARRRAARWCARRPRTAATWSCSDDRHRRTGPVPHARRGQRHRPGPRRRGRGGPRGDPRRPRAGPVADPADPGAAEQLPLGLPRTDGRRPPAGRTGQLRRPVRRLGPGGARARRRGAGPEPGRGQARRPVRVPGRLPADVDRVAPPGVRARIAVEAVLPATHVLLEAMRPVLATTCGTADADGWDFGLGRADLDALLRSGRRVGLLFHGSEVRRPDRHRSEYRFSPFHSPAARRGDSADDRGDRTGALVAGRLRRTDLRLDAGPARRRPGRHLAAGRGRRGLLRPGAAGPAAPPSRGRARAQQPVPQGHVADRAGAQAAARRRPRRVPQAGRRPVVVRDRLRPRGGRRRGPDRARQPRGAGGRVARGGPARGRAHRRSRPGPVPGAAADPGGDPGHVRGRCSARSPATRPATGSWRPAARRSRERLHSGRLSAAALAEFLDS